MVGRPFAVALFPMVPIFDVLQQKKYLVRPYVSRGAWVGLNRKLDFDILRDKLGMDVAP